MQGHATSAETRSRTRQFLLTCARDSAREFQEYKACEQKDTAQPFKGNKGWYDQEIASHCSTLVTSLQSKVCSSRLKRQMSPSNPQIPTKCCRRSQEGKGGRISCSRRSSPNSKSSAPGATLLRTACSIQQIPSGGWQDIFGPNDCAATRCCPLYL